MNTLTKYEQTRNQQKTIFSPDWLQSCKIERYLASKGTANNKLINFDLFTHVTKMSENKEVIQAIGYNSLTNQNTVLILKR